MVAFYGESYGPTHLRVVTGFADLYAIFYHFDEQSSTLTEGDAFVSGHYADPSDFGALADAADDIVVTWCIEVGDGSSGTLALSSGLDPSGTADPSAATQALGSFAAAGASTIVTGRASITGADLAAFLEQPVLRVACISGTVVIRQVKLRAWPSAGPGGAWVDGGMGQTLGRGIKRWTELEVPGSNPAGLMTATVDDWQNYPDPGRVDAAAFDAENKVRAALYSKIGTPANFTHVDNLASGTLASSQLGTESILFVLYDEPRKFYYTGEAFGKANLGVIQADVAGKVPDVPTTFADPREVRLEPESYVRPTGGGKLQPRFGEWMTAAFKFIYQTTSPPAWASEAAFLRQYTLTDFAPQFNEATGYWQIPFQIPPGASGGHPGDEAGLHWSNSLNDFSADRVVGFAGGDTILVEVHVPGVNGLGTSRDGVVDAEFDGAPVHGYGFNVSAIADIVDTGHLIVFGPIEVYQPAAVPVVLRKPRFFVTYTEVDDDPRDVSHVVGIGKPADDASIFRVPTPLGTLRELRHGEKVSDVSVAYPLKVKLEDGSWTVVAGMTPDE